jgi:hypothetical protein
MSTYVPKLTLNKIGNIRKVEKFWHFRVSIATKNCVNLGTQRDRGNEDNHDNKKINGNLSIKVTAVTKVSISITEHW